MERGISPGRAEQALTTSDGSDGEVSKAINFIGHTKLSRDNHLHFLRLPEF